jgi:hypothetical protein
LEQVNKHPPATNGLATNKNTGNKMYGQHNKPISRRLRKRDAAEMTWFSRGLRLAAGFILQSTFNLTPPVTWIDVTNPPEVVGAQFTVTNPSSASPRFYRLSKP